MNIRSTILLIIGVFSLKFTIQAQDPQFSQFYANPLILSPSFAGGTNGSRASVNYRNQWIGLPNAFITYSFSYDHFFYKKNLGLGFYALKDEAGVGGLTLTSIGLLYAYVIQINRKVSIRPGLRLIGSSRGLNYADLIFKDQLVSGSSASQYDTPGESKFYMDAAVSVAVYGRKIWGGTTIDHLFRPNQSLMGGTSRVPVKYSLFGGIKLKRGKYVKYRDKSFTLTFLYKHQEKFDQLDFGLYWHRYPIVIGLWHRGLPFKTYDLASSNHDALIFLLGLKLEHFFVGYSYDLTISPLWRSTDGSHEVSLVFEFFQNQASNKKQNKGIIACPKF